jgi:hypothetical protein
MWQIKVIKGWKHIMPLKICSHKNKKFAFSFSWVYVEITFWIIFAHFKYIVVALDLN